MSSSLETDQSVGYEMHPFEERLAELETRGSAPPHSLAFFASYAGERTHQFYFDRFLRLRGTPDWPSLRAEAEATLDGHRGAAHNYLTHGLHSYKGKYFPQVVRSLLNHGGLAQGDTVVDPFVGSGTTTLEASLMGFVGYGIDRNPLAALISRTKHLALTLDPSSVEDEAREIIEKVSATKAVPLPNRDYLCRWFPTETLCLIERILAAIAIADVPKPMNDVARLTLSTLLRGWSLQEPSQLRVHRRENAPPPDGLLSRFETDLLANAHSIGLGVRLLRELDIALAPVEVIDGDARTDRAWASQTFDALVTSPPYATALPYIDTDRLSIYALGLDRVEERSDLEWSMIGNREIRQGQRRELEAELEENESELPESVVNDILLIKSRNDAAGVGFRRKNLPALLYRYFSDMKAVLGMARENLRSGALCAVVVGDSYTQAGNDRFQIRTADFLCCIAERLGFSTEERIEMGGQTAYLPHQRNGIQAEEILVLRSPV